MGWLIALLLAAVAGWAYAVGGIYLVPIALIVLGAALAAIGTAP